MSHLQFPKLIFIPLILVALSGCGKTLNVAKIEDTIKSSLTKQGGTSIKSVICPENVKPEAGKTFECTGILDSGAGFAIAVQQQDDQGNIVWEVSSVKGLVNMAQLQTELNQGLKKEVGQASIDCGNANSYRPVKPGEMFECQLLKRDAATKPVEAKDAEKLPAEDKSESKPEPSPSSTKPVKSNDIIQVTIQPSGDISWQRIIKVADAKVADSKLPAPKASDAATPETPKPDASKPETPNPDQAPNPPAAKSPEDFLKQPGAADDFN